MSPWRRKTNDAKLDAATDAVPEFTDVKIVKQESTSSKAPIEGSGSDETDDDVLAELSVAFGDDDAEPTKARDAGLTTIAIGGADDLPDAVYLDDGLVGAEGSEPVFIDDDGTSDALLTKDAAGPGIELRLRQRRIGVRRAEGRRRLFRWGVVAGVFVVVVAVLAVLGSSLFSVNDIRVSGVQRADADAVMALVDDLIGEPVLLVDTEAAEERLEQIPYIDSARVRTDFPNGITVEVREREPVATAVGADGRFRILDQEGRVVDVIDGQPIAFVLVSGPTTLDLEAGEYADTGYAAAASMVTKLTPDVRSQMISMSVVPDGADLRFLLSNEPGSDIEVRLGAAITDNDQIERLVRLQRVLDDVAGSDTTIIDVSTSETTER
ncbi:FtsQ-type POTRA domain-containing protein [bacterium]|nr:FtsQ-type POTRA domain-containing protein [bacterium]